MKANKVKTITISKELMGEFDSCLGDRSYGGISFTAEQDAIILKYMGSKGCIRKDFYEIFHKKFNTGSAYSLRKRYNDLTDKKGK